MKPQEMDQEKLLAFMKAYLERSTEDVHNLREKFYDAVIADNTELAGLLLREMVVKLSVHAMLLEELLDAKEYQEMMQVVQKLSENAPEA
jgi:dephospho-CoA kinase